MPAGMPGIVSKGRIVRALDAVLADKHKRQEFYERLVKRKSNGDFEESLIELAADPRLLALSPDEVAHLRICMCHPSSGCDTIGFIIKFFRVKLIEIPEQTTAQ